jgi:hypothetical protein
VEAVLHGLAYYCPILDDDNGILSSKVISTLSSGEVVRSLSVRGNRTSPSTIGVNRAVYSV